ncbi:MAG: DMT family transporter [Nanoarchaeota archaeon]|nr:DMT family transporter [Nanoarchaeota archaeon]MBU1135739.1 DMT family transporter [Nanoarchaeota archaeon]MBU2520160.1 DMT family transporter [Nanoarchaeota archaeon]
MAKKPVSKNHNKELIGTILALITAVISGFAIPINKIFVVGIDPTVFTAVRALIIGLVFLFISFVQGNFSTKSFKKVSWKPLLFIGFIGGGLAFLFFFTGLGLTTAGRAAFLHKLLPVFIAVFAVLFLKEKIPRKQGIALLVMLVGAYLIFSATIEPAAFWLNPGFGDILIIGATILWALESTIAKRTMIKGETNFIVSFARMFFGGLLLFGIIILLGKFDILLSLSAIQITNMLISTGILFGYVLFWYASIKYINVSKAAAILLLAPVISLFLGIYWFGEPFPLLQMIGSALIIIGAVVVVKIKSQFSTGV